MTSISLIDQYIENHLDRSLEELSRLVAQPSIAAQNIGLEECAAMVRDMLQARGFEVEIAPSSGPPVVIGKQAGRAPQTLLFYNHYDVQPPEPLELWETPPFEASVRDGKMYGRGISDNKGHIVSRMLAIEAILAVEGELPCAVKFVIEGEEETGSPNMRAFVQANQEKLAADVCIWESGGVDHLEIPIQYLGWRGICFVELRVRTANADLHSGLGGTIFPNAAWRLVWALNSLKDRHERVQIRGFYDSVKKPSDLDWELMSLLPDVADEYRNRYGIKEFLRGVTGGTELHINRVFEPSCTICGLTSGYQGKGTKTVLPAEASAKIDFRLVPDQTPEQVLQQLRTHLDENGFSDFEMTFLGGEPPGRTDPNHPFIKLVMDEAIDVYGVKPHIHPMVGGSGPAYPFIHFIGVPVTSAGIAYPGTRGHAPNENIRLDLFVKGAKHIARIINAYGETDL